MPLPNFTVTGNIFHAIGDVESSELLTPAYGVAVIFTPNLPADAFVTWSGGLYKVDPVTAKVISDGTLCHGPLNAPVRLLANDNGLNIDGLQWKVDIYLDNSNLVSAAFDAPADGVTLDLKDIIPAPEPTDLS
jgi:hypothetical protein